MKIESRAPTLALSILPGRRPADSRATILELDGYISVPIDLPPAQFRVVYILAVEKRIDMAAGIAAHLSGYRPSQEIARLYRQLLNHRHPVDAQHIRNQVMLIRRALEEGIKRFELVNGIRFERDLTVIETWRGYGYRTGAIESWIDDHNKKLIPTS